MQKVIFILTLTLLTSFLGAQNHHKEILDLILEGDKAYTIFEEEYDKELTKEFTGKVANEERMHNATLESFYQYGEAAMLSQNSNIYINDSVIVNKLMFIRPHLINAGIYYNEKENYFKATDAFLAYWDYEQLQPFLQRHDVVTEQDSTTATIKYYAAICAIQSKDTDRSIELLNRLISESYIKNNTYKESDPYELLALQYETKEDQEKLIETLKTGIQKFPSNEYFPPSLVNTYFKAGKHKEAIAIIQKMIKEDPSKYNTLMPVIAGIYLQEKDYKNAEKSYKAILKKEKDNTTAMEGLGRMYGLMAQDKKDEIALTTNNKQQKKLEKEAVKRYKKALPYLEKQYQLLSSEEEKDNNAIKGGLYLLQNIYYNLSLFDAKQEENYQKVSDLLDELNK